MRKFLLLTFFVLTASLGALAQGVTTATVSGVVKAQNGELIPGANIIATHVPSGTVYGTASRENGQYNFPAVRVGGPYTIKVSFVGYKEFVQENIYMQLGQTLVLDVKLVDDATQLQEIEVSGVQDPVLNSDKIGASSNFSVNQINQLPSIARDFRDISKLTPQAGGSTFTFGGRSSMYNNVSIDGATMNNVFGLSPLPAGYAPPFSLDAIQELTVSLSPYDLRQGSFTGAGISAVTRSGTNDLSGSAYYFFRNESFAGDKVDGETFELPSFDYKNFGFRLGGPIIKDKLFFFVNAEFESRLEPFITNPIRANRGESITGKTQATDDNDPETGLAGLRQFLIDNFNYDPGKYKDIDRETESQRYVMRFDYNINQNHKLTLRGNITNAFQDFPPSASGAPGGGRGNNNNVLSFSSSFYRLNNNQYSVTAELNSILGGGKFSNNLVAGYSAFRDFRENAGGLPVPAFPLVDIIGPNGSNLTSFGPDPFTINNKLDQDVIQLNDNFSIYKGAHTITIGTANEYYSFNNVFTPQYNGVYRYNSLAEFYADANPETTGTNRPAQYQVQYETVRGGPAATAAKWEALQLGFFAQDEFTGINNLKLTAGVRVDIPLYLTDLAQNNYVNAIDFNGEKLRVGAWPEVKPLWSPRFGFNWDVKGDRSTQVRGGSGILTGRVPFVWLSNTVSNNGLFFGSINLQGTNVPFTNTGDGIPYDFSTTAYRLPSDANASLYADLAAGIPPLVTNTLDRNYGRPTAASTMNTLSKDFRFPQVWRSNLAVDQQLPWGMVGTLEFIYTKDVNAVFIRDANLATAQGTLQGDGRPLYGAQGSDRQIVANDRRLSGDVGQALVLDNTSKGYQWSITGQLRKDFSRDFSLSVAYTYTDAREVNPQSASTANSIFGGQVSVTGPNSGELSYSSALTPHRVIAYGSWRKEYLNHFATTLGLTFEGRSGNNFSYTYNGDVNSDGNTANDLIYIPRSQDEIVLTTSGATDTRTLDQIWSELDAFISQDDYLSEHRGEYAARNAAYQPWVSQLNLSLLQDFFIDIKGKRNTLQLSAQVENILNMFDSGAGIFRNAARPSLLRFVGYEQPHTAGGVATPVATTGPAATQGLPWAPTTGRPVFAFDANADGTPLTESYVPSQAVASRWQLQLGVRYIF